MKADILLQGSRQFTRRLIAFTFALLFLLGDTVATALVRLIDPRLGPREGEA